MNSRLLKKYKLPKERVNELKHFSLQYSDWCDRIEELSVLTAVSIDGLPHGTGTSDPTASSASACEREKEFKAMVDSALEACSEDENMRKCVRLNVTERESFEVLKRKSKVLWEADAFYLARRKYFFILDRLRG